MNAIHTANTANTASLPLTELSYKLAEVITAINAGYHRNSISIYDNLGAKASELLIVSYNQHFVGFPSDMSLQELAMYIEFIIACETDSF